MATKKIGIITQARTTSTRLPKKVLLMANGQSVLDHHLHRLKQSGLDVFVATTTNTEDEPIVRIAEKNGVGCHRGSEYDVLARFYETAKKFELDIIVRVTSDCPLIDGKLIKEGVERFQSSSMNTYLSNCIERTFPRGFDFEVFSFQSLEKAFNKARDISEREHVTPFIRNEVSNIGVKLIHLKQAEDNSSFRLTLDEQDDWILLKTLIEDYHADKLGYDAIINLLKAHPELSSMNSHIEQKKV